MSVLSSLFLAVLMTEPGALKPGMGHVQGIDATDEAIYLSHDKGLFKIDWNGKLLASVAAPRHTGDICVWKGRVYTAAHLVKPGADLAGGDGGGLVEVYDTDLKLVKSRPLDFGIDGITCVDGRLYVGIGRNHPRPMRGHVIGFLDAETLEPQGTCGTDYGHLTHWGVQDLAYDGESVWFMYYPAKGEPGCGRFSKDLAAVTSVKTPLSNGFCVAPKRFWRNGKPTYLSGYMMKDEKAPRVRIDFWRFNGTDFEKIAQDCSSEARAAAGWEPSVKRALDDLVEKHRGDPTAYAVFDFDYTLAIGDSSYVCIWQILETGDFRGGDMVKLMSEDVPAELLPQVEDLFAATDGVQRVRRFWPLYRRLWNDPGEAFGCEWRSRLFTGYTPEALAELARTAMHANAKRVGHRPDVNVPTEKRGFVILPEVRKLVHDLRAAGIATYVVSGSYSGVLGVATGPEFGLDIPPDCVFGCDTGVVAGKKADFIRSRLASRHGGRDPVLVAGDSMGDYAMFTELPGVEKALVFRRQNGRKADEPLRKIIDGAPGPDGKYLVQGRDEPNGRMIPSHESVFR